MGKRVEISQATLLALVLTLMVSLMGLAFLLGRQSVAAPFAVVAQSSSPDRVILAVSTPGPEKGIPSERFNPRPPRPLVALRSSGGAVVASQSEPISTPRNGSVSRAPRTQLEAAKLVPSGPPRKASPAATVTLAAPSQDPEPRAVAPKAPDAKPKDSAPVREYFDRVDAAMLGTQALGDPNQFATQLLGQSLQGDSSGFESLLGSVKATREQVRSIQVPLPCQEHHTLLVRQLDQSLTLLSQVKQATTSLDTASLTSLSSQGKGLQAEAARFQQLDQQLRKSF